MTNYVFAAPGNDAPARTLASWSTEIERRAKASGHNIAASPSGTATTAQSITTACSSGIRFCYFGHGTWTELTGSVSLINSSNVASLSGCEVVAIACQSAHTLGPEAVSAGAIGYLGFDEYLHWLTRFPDVDRFRDVFVDAFDQLHSGGSLTDAEGELLNGFEKLFDYYRYQIRVSHPDRTFGYLLADWNRRHVKLCQPPHLQSARRAPSSLSANTGVPSSSLHVASVGELAALRNAVNREPGSVLIDAASGTAVVRDLQNLTGSVILQADYVLAVNAALNRINPPVLSTFPVGMPKWGFEKHETPDRLLISNKAMVILIFSSVSPDLSTADRLNAWLDTRAITTRHKSCRGVVIAAADPLPEAHSKFKGRLTFVLWRSASDNRNLGRVLRQLLATD